VKVLLTQPITFFVKEPPNIPDLGLGYIAAALKRAGHDVHIRDWNMPPGPEEFRHWLAANRPDVVGVKIFTKDVYAARKTVAMAREVLPKALVVIGGPHPSCVSDPAELMEDFAECDYAIGGEAEISLPALLEAYGGGDAGGGRLGGISGFVRRVEGGAAANPKALIHDLDSLGFPAWEMIDPNGYQAAMLGSERPGASAPVITTRGCPGRCTFCSAFNINGRRIRARSPEHVFEEISLLYDRYGVRKLMFQDNCFTQNAESLSALCESIINSRMDLEWDCVTYEQLGNLTPEALSMMHRAGCRMIHMGIESGSVKTRKVMNKWCSLGEVKEKAALIRKSGIKLGTWFMLGFPGETRGDMRDTVDYAFSLGADVLTFTICFPLPGSRVYEHIKEKYGFRKVDWASFDIYSSPYPVSEVSSSELTRLVKKLRLRIRVDRKLRRVKALLGLR
jgi:radical SAM superfamily enzyme YgiQ (UPF0313 family)